LAPALTRNPPAGTLSKHRMKLRLPRNRSLGEGLVALAAGLTLEAAEQLDDLAASPVGSVHRARVALKRARSTLRLLEKAGADWAIMPRYRLSELAGRMSVAREAAVAADLARALSRRLRGRERQVARLLAARQGPFIPSDAEELKQALLRESRELSLAPPPAVSPVQLCELLRRSLARTARRYYAAAMQPTLESVHEWRKALIVLRDQTTMAAARWPSGAGEAQPLLVKFARQLGRRGDLALLVRCLQHPWVPPALGPARRSLLARLKAQREQATLTALLRWLSLERRLARLLAGK